MASRKTKVKASRKSDSATRQNQPQDKRGYSSVASTRSISSLEIKPKVGQAERLEDAAVFNKDCRLKLSAEIQIEAVNVNEALELTYQGKFEEAIGLLQDIARSSPMADWRLFIRGLHAFYSGELETARQNWTRLDRSRRPARIAATLHLVETTQPLDGEISSVSESLVEHAKTLRLRKDAVASAQAIANVKHRGRKATFSVSQVAMLSNFIDSYRKLDLGFVSSVGQACVGLALNQGDMEIFDRLTKMVPGTASDPKWNRTRMLYSMEFENSLDDIEKASVKYIEQDLPKLTQLPEALRNALACKIYLVRAELERISNEDSSFSFSSFFSFRESKIDLKKIDGFLRKAIQSYPTYRLAHQKLISSLESQLEKYDISKSEEDNLEMQIIVAKEELVRALPDDVETALELIDFYLDEDQLDKADVLVKQLSGQRLEDPLAKALPWKLKLREAMRLSRRKSDLEFANKALDEAESIWPTWLNRNWLPYLRAGLALRGGDQAKFTQLTTAARKEQKTSDLVGDVMTFAALQQMNIPSSDLKPFRTGVESQLENASKIEVADLFSVGSFFWDLVRTGLKHKGYRLQASKFGRAFADKIKSNDNSNLSATQIDAFSWGAHHRFWPLGNDYTPTPSIKKLAMNEPRIAAVVLAWLLEMKDFLNYDMIDYEPLIALVKEAARTEKDAFYRYMFDKAADGANNIISEANAEEEQRRSFDDDDDDDDYEDDDYEDEDDEDDEDDLEDSIDDDGRCNCPKCRAKRAKTSDAYIEAGVEEVDENDVEYGWDEDDADEKIRRLPPVLAKVFSRLGPNGMADLLQVTGTNDAKRSPEKLIHSIGKLFTNYGLSKVEAIEFVIAFQEFDDKEFIASVGGDEVQDAETGSQASPTMTAEELKAARKQREKDLEKKKREANKSRSRR